MVVQYTEKKSKIYKNTKFIVNSQTEHKVITQTNQSN